MYNALPVNVRQKLGGQYELCVYDRELSKEHISHSIEEFSKRGMTTIY